MSIHNHAGTGCVLPSSAPLGGSGSAASIAALVCSYSDLASAGRTLGSKPASGLKIVRMPTARSIASRATAKASGCRSSVFSPASYRFLNSSVLARNAASSSTRTSDSCDETLSTMPRYRLTSRSLRVPKILRATVETTGMPIDVDPVNSMYMKVGTDQHAKTCSNRKAIRPGVAAGVAGWGQVDQPRGHASGQSAELGLRRWEDRVARMHHSLSGRFH